MVREGDFVIHSASSAAASSAAISAATVNGV